MQDTTVLMVVYNQKELLRKSIETIRKCTEMEKLQVMVIDNASEDGTREWLENQEDIAYVIENEHTEIWGKIVNKAIKKLGSVGDMLFIQAGCLVTIGCIELLTAALYFEDDIAAVGPMINGQNNGVEACSLVEKINRRYVLGLEKEIVMFRGEIFENCFGGKFEEEYYTDACTMLDYFMSANKKGKKLCCVRNAMTHYISEQQDFSYLYGLDRTKMADKWGMKYFNSRGNESLIRMITKKANESFNILEIGCDCGATLLEIKNRFPNAKIYGYEINPCAAEIAGCFAEVEVGDVEDEQFPYNVETFDYIIFGDVLEHLHNPEKIVQYCKTFLKETGCIIACIPNLMHISVIAKLLEGQFKYMDMGLLDYTHIHFFTFNEIAIMFKKAGYDIEDVVSKNIAISEEENEMIDKIMSIVTSSERWMFETYQYVLRARKV